MITLEKIKFRYKKTKPLFEDLSIHLQAGHVYGLLGKNGAGKTTLLKIISGLNFAQSGDAIILGTESYKRKVSVLQELYFLTEDIYFPNLTIREYVKVYGAFYPHFDKKYFDECLEQFEVSDQSVTFRNLSQGQKKKVMISFALACQTKILFMDEPTNGLDIPSKSIFRKLIAKHANDDRIILISTHQVRDLHSVIDAVIVLHHGNIIFNQDVGCITEKLTFKTTDTIEQEEDVLYSQEDIRGTLFVAENKLNEDSKLDIELLFNALMENNIKINKIFNNK